MKNKLIFSLILGMFLLVSLGSVSAAFWTPDLTINASLPDIGTNSKPSVFYKDSSWYLISGEESGAFFGYVWTGTAWATNLTINASLPDIGGNSAPSVFYKDSSWYLISGELNGKFYGYTWSGTQWVTNLTINASLPTNVNAWYTPSVFQKDGIWYLISGTRYPGADDGKFLGFAWSGTEWLPDFTINDSLGDIGAWAAPSVFQKDGIWYLISGASDGNFYGFKGEGGETLINVTLTYPTNNKVFTAPSNLFNVSLSMSWVNNSYSWINNTYNIWYLNGTLSNQTTVTDLFTNSTNVSKLFNINLGNSIWNSYACYGNLTYNACSWATSNYSFSLNSTINSNTYNSLTYETITSEVYTLNITTPIGYTPSSAYLVYNGTSYSATVTSSGENYLLSKTLQVPPSQIGANTFYYKWNLSSTYAENTTIYNQTVAPILFGICNTTLTVPYINFTFKDEGTSSALNATIDSSTWSYWLGDGTYKKSLLFSNSSLNYFYTFCLFPGNVTMHNTRSIQYSKEGYPQRKYDASSDLTNATTNQILYLLSSADGIYSTIQVVDEEGDKISNVEVTVERQFAGIWTIVGQETTDDAGLVTFWVNPDYDHKFTFAIASCVGTTVTIRPTQTQYTQQLQCGIGADIYVSQIEGIKYARTPSTGIIQAGTYNFSYQLVSSKSNIINMSFKLVNSSTGAVLNSTWSSCNPGGCTIYVMHTVNLGDDIKGKYYFDIGNGTVLIEGDARWRVIDIPTAGKAGILTFIRDMKYVIDEWGDDSDTDDFNRLVIVFFFMCLAISTLNYNLGSDTSNPGAFLIIMTFVILMGSLSGSFVGGEMTGQGFFYFNNLSGNDFINNYILLGFTLIITISYFLNVNRQAQR